MKKFTQNGLLSALAVAAFLAPSCKKDAKTNNDAKTDSSISQSIETGRKQKVESMDGNLIAYWPLNWADPTEDAGPNGHVLSFSNITGTSDHFLNANYAVFFPTAVVPNNGSFGLNDAIDLRLSGTDFTLNAWIKLDSYNTGNDSRIMDKRLTGNSGWGFSVTGDAFSAGHGHLLFGPAYSGSGMAYSTGTVSLNAWHMVSVVYILASHETDFYIDGVLSGSTTGIASPSSTENASLQFGVDGLSSTGGGSAFYGAMDNIRIYKVAHNAADLGVLYNETNPTGLIAYWSFDNNADDVSNNHYFGSAINTLAVSDRFGVANNAYNFDGSTSYVGVGDHVPLRLVNTDFSFNVWVYVNAYGTSDMELIVKHFVFGTGWGWRITSSGYDTFESGDSGGIVTSSTGTTNIATGGWHMLTVTYQYSTGTLTHYVDGVSAGSYSSGFPIPATTNKTIRIGCDVSAVNFFDGNIDDLSIYNKVLTTTEIAKLKNTQF